MSASFDLHAVWQRNAVRRKEPEKKLMQAVLGFLDLALPVGAVVNHCPGEGKRTKRAQADLIANGYCAGWPDLEIVWNSRIYFIELKAARGVVSAAQRETHKRLLYANAPVMICKSVDDVERGLRECGVPLRASVL